MRAPSLGSSGTLYLLTWNRSKPISNLRSGLLVLVASSILAAVLGSVHGFSVFLVPLEAQFDVSRGQASLVYSLALVFLTAAVFVGHRIYAFWPPFVMALVVGGLGVIGVLFAGVADWFGGVLIGYSVLFGLANGLGYGFGLQFAGQANPGKEGIAMGVVTAAYALGAAISPLVFELGLSMGGFRAAMHLLAIALVVASLISALLFHFANRQFSKPLGVERASSLSVGQFLILWVGYGAGVMAGLMAIGHATGIALSLGFEGAIWLAPALISAAGFVGSLLAGKISDLVSAHIVLAVLSLLSALALLCLALLAFPSGVLLLLGVVGLCYGGIIAVYPAAISKIFGADQSARIYGKIFTAWGFAGLIAPWFAGLLYDASQAYNTALLLACGFAVVSFFMALSLARVRA